MSARAAVGLTSACPKGGTDSVFGRLVNARPGSASVGVCTAATECQYVTGQFIHIKQAALARRSDFFDGWATAILNTLDGEGRRMQK
jgi:hypothetical protein